MTLDACHLIHSKGISQLGTIESIEYINSHTKSNISKGFVDVLPNIFTATLQKCICALIILLCVHIYVYM